MAKSEYSHFSLFLVNFTAHPFIPRKEKVPERLAPHVICSKPVKSSVSDWEIQRHLSPSP
jgi:hypothetical protein